MLLFECSRRVVYEAVEAAQRELHPSQPIIASRRGVDLRDLRFQLLRDLPGVQPLFFHGGVVEFERDFGADLLRLDEAGCRWDLSWPLPPTVFETVKKGLDRKYFVLEEISDGEYTPVASLTEPARQTALSKLRQRRRGWPHLLREEGSWPDTLPGGEPWPLISIVTPSFNQGQFIEETILSVLRQDYPKVEHIVIDGGSTDETSGILRRFGPQLAHVVSEKDGGQSHAINKGMAVAKGEILTWLNSDDMLAPGALRAMALAFHTSRADMVAGVCSLYENGACIRHHLTACENGPLPLERLLDLEGSWHAGQFFYQPEVMFTRDLWRRAGGHVREDLHYSMDYDLWVRFAEEGANLHVIGRPVAWYRVHEEQKTAFTADFHRELEEYRTQYYEAKGQPVPPAPPLPGKRHQLRIVLVNDMGSRYGAGIAHQRIARALQWAGHDVSVVAPGDEKSYLFSRQQDLDRLLAVVTGLRPDAIIVGNLHGAGTSPDLVRKLGRIAPVFPVLHDFWLLTGRCAYMGDCDKYLTGCDETCPTPNEYPALPPDQIRGAWERKRSILASGEDITTLAPSSWALSVLEGMRAAAGGALDAVSADQFRHPTPTRHFTPMDKATCRNLLGLPRERFIILVSGSLSDPRKGLSDVFEAVRLLDLPDLVIVVAGSDGPVDVYPPEVINLGYLETREKTNMAYSAADIFVGASRFETFGQVFVEASACGTPAIGYAGSGVSEAIAPGLTGSLVEERNPSALSAEILRYYRKPALCRVIGQLGRIHVENERSEQRAYLSLLHAWRRTGHAQRWGLRGGASFWPEAPPLPAILNPFEPDREGVLAHDLGDLEPPVPEHGLDSYRWAYGPTTQIKYRSAERGRHSLFLQYRNPQPRQRIRVWCDGDCYHDGALPTTGYGRSNLLMVDLELRQGANKILLEFSEWKRAGWDKRPLAIIVEDFQIAPLD